MKDALQIFAAGLGAVFTGMLLLYISIRLTGFLVERTSKGGPDDE
jgi:hypothetical protein